MRLAESLGATVTMLPGENAATEIIAFARSRNVGKIVVGKTERPRWKKVLFGSFIDDLIRESGDIDVYVVRGDDSGSGATGRAGEPEQPPIGRARGFGPPSRSRAPLTAGFGGAPLIVALTPLLAPAFYQPPDLSEDALILLGGIVVCAIWCGRGPATFASVLSVLPFNFFFTEPRFSLSVNDPTYLLTFGVMLSAGLIVGTLAARTSEQARAAWDRER